MTKHKMMVLTLFILLLTVLSGCSVKEKPEIEAGSKLTMFVATDIHYLAKDLTDNGNAYQKYQNSGDGRQLNYIDEIMNAFVEDIRKQKPDILIISGDLTNNGEKESHLKLAEKLKEIEETTGTSIYVIPGNHDINNPWAREFQGDNQIKTKTITAKDFKSIYHDFGYGEAISKDKDSLSYLAAPSEDVWLLMLDTNEYDQNQKLGYPTTNGKISEETFDWIRKCSDLAKEKHAKLITVMHHNLFNHSTTLHYGFTLDNGDEAEKVFRECDINLVLSGHIHVQDIRSREKDSNTVYDIVTGALCIYPEHYGIIKYMPSQGFDYSTASVDVESWAKETGSKDENLLNFTGYTKNRSKQRSYDRAYQSLTKIGGFSEHDKEAMAETVSLLNMNYFTGTTGLVRDEILASEGYQLWLACDDTVPMRDYVLSMIPRDDHDNNKLFIPFSPQDK